MPIEIDLAGQAWRIDAAPADVEALVRQLLSAALEQNPANEREIDNRRRAQSARLWQRLRELRVVGPDESITLDALLRSIQSEVSADIANALTPRTLWTTPPYSTLGGIPIATSDAEAAAISAPRVRDFFPAIEGGRAEASYPIFGAEPAGGGNTWWMHYSNSWWTALLVTQYRAHTSTTADGWEAADLAGGMYATAKTACQQLQVPASGDPDYRFVIALIKAASCQYAKTAPEVCPFTGSRP